MANAAEYMLDDLRSDYAAEPVPKRIARLYEDDPEWGHLFGVLHSQLNSHFESINGRINTNRHYWANPSRELIKLFSRVEKDLHTLAQAGVDVEFKESYEDVIERVRPWLSPSGGSPLPEDFREPIEVERYVPVFTRSSTKVKLTKQAEPDLTMVGSGSYANVFSYIDPDYGIKFALKRAKKGISERDLERFRAEFDTMKGLSHPNLVEVYHFDPDRNEYRMEYCDETLRDFIKKRNSRLPTVLRKAIALQFLEALRYLHGQGLLHRDISLQNVLLKVYGSGDVLVKLSDFGLVKDQSKNFTLTSTDMRGTIRDPMLTSFKEYDVANEVYAVGWVLSYIVTGRESLMPPGSPLGDIVQSCTHHTLAKRFESVGALIRAIQSL